MVGNTQKEQFTNLRFDNYATARNVGFTCGSFIRNALYLNGLTIELTYKQMLLESINFGRSISKEEHKIINKSHDLETLHKLCVSKSLLTEMTDYESPLRPF